REAAGHRQWRAAVGARAAAELSAAVVPPAVRRPTAHETARLSAAARAQGGEREVARHRDRPRAVREIAGAELAVVIVAPAVRGPGDREPARVVLETARAHRAEGQPAGDLDGRRGVRGGAVAELADAF